MSPRKAYTKTKLPKTKIEIFFTDEEIEKLETIAAKENRSRSAAVRSLVLEAIAKREEPAS